MFLKFSFECTCGCKFELNNLYAHSEVACPNCSKHAKDSEKFISLLSTMNAIDSGNDSFVTKTSDGFAISASINEFPDICVQLNEHEDTASNR